MDPARFAARQAVSLWSWSYLTANTVGRFTEALARSATGDSKQAFGAAVHAWARGNMRRGFHRCETVAGAALPAPAVILVNHQCIFDIALVASIIPPPLYFVARLEVGRVPLIGSVLRRGGHVFVRRGAGAANEAAFDEAAARLRQGGRVVFFGEGTRSSRDDVLPLRSGAFRLAAGAGVPLVPLVLAGTRMTFPSGAWPIVPTRMAAEFLSARAVGAADARSSAYRDGVRREMSATLTRLAPGTGSRI